MLPGSMKPPAPAARLVCPDVYPLDSHPPPTSQTATTFCAEHVHPGHCAGGRHQPAGGAVLVAGGPGLHSAGVRCSGCCTLCAALGSLPLQPAILLPQDRLSSGLHPAPPSALLTTTVAGSLHALWEGRRRSAHQHTNLMRSASDICCPAGRATRWACSSSSPCCSPSVSWLDSVLTQGNSVKALLCIQLVFLVMLLSVREPSIWFDF